MNYKTNIQTTEPIKANLNDVAGTVSRETTVLGGDYMANFSPGWNFRTEISAQVLKEIV